MEAGMGKSSGGGGRRVYERPQLGTVKLAADEVLISGCKTESGSVFSEGSGYPCSSEFAACQNPGDFGS